MIITCLSVRQPWAWLLVKGIKDVENRGYPTDYRGELYIHASKTYDHEGSDWLDKNMPGVWIDMPRWPMEYDRGALVGRVNLVTCRIQHHSKWFSGPWGWVVNSAQEIEPIHCRGRLQVFELDVNLARIISR